MYRRFLSQSAGLVGSATLMLLPWSGFAAGAISQSFTTTATNVIPGTIMALASGGAAPATTSTAARIVGVADSKPLVELSAATGSSVEIATSGIAEVLVTDINGRILTGDKITISPISGIGMRETAGGEIIGAAEADLSSVKTVRESIHTASGTTKDVLIGQIPVSIGITYISGTGTSGLTAALVPPAVQSLANDLAGKSVSPWRVLTALVVLILGFGIAATMLITSIRAGMISVGRNPLARSALLSALIDVIVASLGILAATLVGVYLLLIAFA